MDVDSVLRCVNITQRSTEISRSLLMLYCVNFINFIYVQWLV